MSKQDKSTSPELEKIFATLNGSDAHACYCPRSTDGGCKCALKDEYVQDAKAAIQAHTAQAVLKERAEFANQVMDTINEFDDLPEECLSILCEWINPLASATLSTPEQESES